MNYTKEFEEWIAEVSDKLIQEPYCWEHTSPLSRRAAHFWLYAFARLVREEAKMLANQASHGRGSLPNEVDFGEAFNSICERFKLEPK